MCLSENEMSFETERFTRLSEYAPTYFDLSSFPEGEMKRALERARNKGKVVFDSKKKGKAQAEKRENKKAKLEA